MPLMLALILAAGTCPALTSFPAPQSCVYTGLDAGVDPDPACTPGDFDPALTVAQLCSEGQSRRCKPDAAVKRRILAAYGVDPRAPIGEIDHRIPLCAGGMNTAKNLWPQPAAEFRRKDVVEAAACRAICRGQISPEAARAMVLDWRGSYRRLHGKEPHASRLAPGAIQTRRAARGAADRSAGQPGSQGGNP